MEYIDFRDFKQMEYADYIEDTSGKASVLLAYNKINNIEFAILNYRGGSHPCAYIKLPNYIDWEDEVECHGGVTYQSKQNPWSRKPNDICEDGMIWVGWDYAHYCDYTPPYKTLEMFNTDSAIKNVSESKWTLEQILYDVTKAIESIEPNIANLRLHHYI